MANERVIGLLTEKRDELAHQVADATEKRNRAQAIIDRLQARIDEIDAAITELGAA